MKAHYYYRDTIVAGGSTQELDQLNITPTLGDSNQLINQAQFYQQYKFLRISYSLRVVNLTGGMCGTRLPSGSSLQPLTGLMDVFKVRVESDQIPDVNIANYTSYHKLSHQWSDKTITGSFIPYVSVSQGETRTFKQFQQISTDNLLMKAYGESILFASNDFAMSPTTYLVTGVVTA